MKLIKIVLILGFGLFMLFGGYRLIVDILAPGAEPDYELPKLKRDMVFAPEGESMSLSDAFEDVGLTLPRGIPFIDYGSDEYILYLERYENDEDSPIDLIIFFYSGERELSNIRGHYAVTDYGAERTEAEYEGSVREGNIIFWPGTDQPLSKTLQLEDVSQSIGDITNYHRVYVSWSREASPAGLDIPSRSGFAGLMMSIQERFGGVGAPLAILLITVILLYFTFFRWYRRRMLRNYGYDVMGWPAKFTIGSYALVMGLAAAGIITDPFSASATGLSDMQRILLLLAIGALGMLWQTISFFAATRRLFLTIFNFALMYIICFFSGYLIVFVVGLYLILKFTGLAFKEGLSPPRGGKCSRCGARLNGGENSCPSCNATLV